MKHNRTLLTSISMTSLAILVIGAALGAWQPAVAPNANSATSVPEAVKDGKPETEADQLLESAIQRLMKHKWIQADIRLQQIVHGSDKVLHATGRHLQGGENEKLKIRRELHVTVGGVTSHLLEVYDGDVFKRRQAMTVLEAIKPSEDVQRVEVSKILQELKVAGKQAEIPRLLEGIGITGLDQLLRGLQASFDFDEVQQAQWQGKEITILRGQWNSKTLERFRPFSSQSPETGDREQSPAGHHPKDGRDESFELPRHIPNQVKAYVDPQTGVPYRIEFHRRSSDGETTEILNLELTDVVLNKPIDESEFTYLPPEDVQERDFTPQLIMQIRGRMLGGEGLTPPAGFEPTPDSPSQSEESPPSATKPSGE